MFYCIDVVYFFALGQKSTEGFLHDEDMFTDPTTVLVGARVIRFPCEGIPVTVSKLNSGVCSWATPKASTTLVSTII